MKTNNKQMMGLSDTIRNKLQEEDNEIDDMNSLEYFRHWIKKVMRIKNESRTVCSC